ncbi:MAG: hypothetical protein JWN93_3747 [Hyphomicrobiales bacterium]|nr:hypothetical protein [Hyphomicrobiales bacterium]
MLHQRLDLPRMHEAWKSGPLLTTVLRRRARTLLIFPLVVLLLAFGVMRFVPFKYRATSVLWLRPQVAMMAADTAPPDANRLAERQQANLYELRSVPLATAVIQRLDLKNEPEFAARIAEGGGLSGRILALVGPTAAGWIKAVFAPEAQVTLKPEEEEAIRRRALAEYLLSNLTASPEGTERVQVSYRASTPRLAYEVLNAVMEEHQRDKLEQKKERSRLALAALRQRIDFLRSRLDEQSRVLVQGETARLIELQNAAESMQADEVVTVPPLVPTQPTRPPMTLVLLLSVFVGLAFGLIAVVLLEARDYLNRLLERA